MLFGTMLMLYVQVVDLWASVDNDPNFHGDSLAVVFSCSKVISAIVFAGLVDMGLVNYADKVQ